MESRNLLGYGAFRYDRMLRRGDLAKRSIPRVFEWSASTGGLIRTDDSPTKPTCNHQEYAGIATVVGDGNDAALPFKA